MDNGKGKVSHENRAGLLKSGLERLFGLGRTSRNPGRNTVGTAMEAGSEGRKAGPSLTTKRADRFPATFGQRQLWFLNRLHPGDDAYHMALSLHITGHPDLAALQSALQAMVDRHDSLRSLFHEAEGELFLRVWTDVRVSVLREDLSALRDGDRQLRAREHTEAFLRKPFDLSNDLPFRAQMIRLSDREHIFIVVVHHIAADGGSISQLARQLSDYYNQQMRQGRIRWTPLPVRSSSWGAEERDFLLSPEAQPMLEFWRRELSDLSATLHWPFASSAKGSSVSTGLGTVRVKPDSSLARDLRAYERQDSGRIFRFLLASLFAFLHRLSGEETVTVGVPVHDRRNSEERETIGLRMKLVPVSIRFGEGDLFSDVLRQLNVKFRDILKNLRMPVGALSELLPTDGPKGGDRLFHTYFNYREDVYDSIRFEGLSVKEYPVDVKGVKTDLSVVVERIPGHEKWVGEGVLFKYDRSRFSEEDVVGLAERWFRLMSLFLRSPDTPLGSLDILLPGEEKLLERFESPENETAGPDSTLHALFQEQASQTPHAPALIGKGLVMTYAELDRFSTRLAEDLIGKGVHRESAVAVRCGRSPETVVAMMAVLKAGGAFVPIDPGDPPGRCQTLMHESGARFVIVCKGHARESFEGVTAVIVDLSEDEGKDVSTSTEIHDPVPSDPASLAYVMFTSGSTGRPKGVMVEHRSIVNRILFMRRFLSFGSGDRTLFKSSPSFDVSLAEVFLPLLSGGAVVIASDTESSDPASVSEWVGKHGVTYIHFVPAMLRAYLEEGFRPGVNDGLRVVWCGGDVLSDSLMRRFLSVSPARLINGYGPTEATVGVTAWECRYEHPYGQPPIGRPVDNTRIRIVDHLGRSLPPGMAGEAWVGGVQVARGYIGDPELTERRFMHDIRGGGRYYRTGDRAVWTKDGNILFLGRADGQLKIRGRRVEPGETEAVIRSLKGILDVHVSGLRDTSGDLTLAAWVRVDPDAFPGTAEMHKRITEALPSHLVPSMVRLVDEWPLDRRGKTDVNALLRSGAPNASHPTLHLKQGEECLLPIASIWEEVLDSESSQPQDDFFHKGGHSLLALRLLALLRERLGVHVRLSDFLEEPTLASLSSLADPGRQNRREHTMVKAPLDAPVPMSHGQRRLWLADAVSRHPAANNILRLIRLEKGVAADAVRHVLARLTERHAILRTRLFTEDGRTLQSMVPVEAMQSSLMEFEMPAVELPGSLSDERDRAFDLSSAPLWRSSLVRTEEGDWLCLVFHHAVTDERSAEIFLNEFETLLSAALQGREAVLPEVGWTFADFACHQTADVDPTLRSRSLSFWSKRLEGVSDAPALEPDFVSRGHVASRSGEVRHMFDEASAALIEAFAAKEDLPLHAVLMAGFGVLLNRLGGRDGSVVGFTVSERLRPEWNEVMGFFLNTLPVHISTDGGSGFRSLCRRLKWELEEAMAHSAVPFVEMLSGPGMEVQGGLRTLSSVLFNMHSPVAAAANAWSDEAVQPSLPPYARRELSCHVRKAGTCIAVRWVYDAGLFDGGRMAAMIDRYAMLLERMVADPDLALGLHPILLPTERSFMETSSSDASVSGYTKNTIHGLVRSSAAAHPESIAVVQGDLHIRFRDLERLSDRIALRLLSLGVGRGEPVGVVSRRHISLPVVLLGVMKAGGAFMPIDPDEPHARFRTMAGVSGMRLLVSSSGCGFPALPGVRVLDMQDLVRDTGDLCEGMSLPRVEPDDPAYVIHTSGSTGVPKGAVLTHGNISVRLLAVRDLFGLGPGDRTLHKTPMSFDVGVTELFQTLVCGGSVAMADADGPVDPARIIDLVCEHAVGYLHVTPSGLRNLLDADGVERVNPYLRTIRCGGESLPRRLMEECLDRLKARLFHTYGPAETAVSVTSWECRKTDTYAHPPIGRPHPGTVLLLLDGNGMPVPPGGIGELYIGGAQVGKGYINQPSLTAERFLDDPLGMHKGLRFFRSGDLFRYAMDGELLFAGRCDEQVKVRGVRVEPSEVAVALRDCPGISEAFVFAEPDEEGSHRLVACLVADGPPDSRSLFRRLRDRLPMPMMPARFHLFESFPTTRHGKVDLPALRKQCHESEPLKVGGSAPLGATERMVASSWSSLLGVQAVCREDDFFSLGGHSLKAFRMLDDIREVTGVEAGLRDLCAAPTLSAFSARLDAIGRKGKVPLVQGIAAAKQMPVSPVQRRIWMLQRMFDAPSAFLVTRLIELPGRPSFETVSRCLLVMQHRHAILRTRIEMRDEGLFQVVEDPASCGLPFSRESLQSDDLMQTLESWRKRKDLLGEGRLWRALLLGCGERVFLYVMFHHAATDEWSVDVFLRELSRLLSVEGDLATAGLPANRWQYTDFTSWHIGVLDDGLRDIQSAFWKDRLADLSGMMRLSPDRVMPQGVPGRSGRIELPLPQTLSSRLHMLSEREGLGLFTLLLSSFHVLLHRWSGEEDIVVGTPVSLRRRAEWQDMMGCFLNMVPVRMGVSGEESFLVFSRRMKSEWERILMHSEIPFADIAACAGGMDGVSFHSFLQVVFTVTGQSGYGGFYAGLSESTRPMETVAVDDLSCLVDVAGGEWKVVFKFDADRFEEARMRRMAETFRHLLDVLTSDPNAALCSHPLMDDGLERGMLSLGRGKITPLPEQPLIHRMFSIQSMRTPSAIAIEERESTVTYSELEIRSDRMACHLAQNHGVLAGDVLAVLLPTGILQSTCLLAAWKAGACVVPIDPSLPKARVRHMLEESGAATLLTGPCIEVPSIEGLRIVNVEDVSADLPLQIPETDAMHDRRAYCMFTSGSTGTPQGVFNTHAGFVNMSLAVSRQAGIGSEDSVLQFSKPTFDVSIFEMFTALLTGARLVVAGNTSLSELSGFIVGRKVTVAVLTPLVIGMMSQESLDSLRVLFTCGEEARPPDVARLSGKLKVINIYGPTECSVFSTLFIVPKHWESNRKVPIGRPIDGVTVRILDVYGHPVPPGMEGEMHVSGIGVGLGYLSGFNKGSSSFRINPSDQGTLTYRTGDMGRWTEDGDILFCGRRDAQVKVMGVRIETEEVRAAFARLPEVEQVFVTVRRRQGSESVMIAFVVMEKGCKSDAGELRDRLAEWLPSYMLPARIHGIESIPKTRHGKTDRVRLDELDEAFLVARESRSELPSVEVPEGSCEIALASIWCDLLGLSTVGREDGFFDLGGDSIGLMRLMEAVKSEWGVSIEISRVYSHLSLKRMASMIQIQREGMIRSEAASESSGVVAVWDPPGGRNVFVMVGGAGQPEEYTKYHRIGQILGAGYRLLVLPDREAIGGGLPRRRLGDQVAEYESMIRREQPEGPYHLMGDCLGGIDAFGVACSLQRSGSEVGSLVLLDTLAPMAPVVRSMAGEGLSAYKSLPERRHPLRQTWFRFRMSIAVMTRGWWHPVPGSRTELFGQAMAYGLFDPSVHARECPVFEGDPLERFAHYIGQGHLQRIAPSGTFNPYRYKKNMPAFDIRSDNPVLHALLIGMRSRFIARKVFRYAKIDNRRSDLMAARSFMRRELFHPGTFRGSIDVVMSSLIHARRPTGGWERYVNGNVRSHRAEGDHRSYLGSFLSVTAAIIGDILNGRPVKGESRDDAKDRRGLRSGGLQ